MNHPTGISIYAFNAEDQLSWSLTFNGISVLENSTIGLSFSNEPDLGENIEVTDTSMSSADETWKPVFGVHQAIRNQYNELRIELREKNFPQRRFSLIFRAYNDGMAFRYLYPEQHNLKPSITAENTAFHFNSDHRAWMADYLGYYSHQEAEFRELRLSDAGTGSYIGLPMLTEITPHCYAAITEAEITDWAGFYLFRKENDTTEGLTLYTRLSASPGGNETSVKVSYEGENWSPWRVVMLGDSPGALIESELIMNLNKPCALDDVSWIQSGKCAWDHWWSGDVKMDTETIERYIRFASDMGFPYMLIDWQWYGDFNKPESDITTVNPAVDMDAVLRYAKEHHVRCWLWLYWTDAERQYEEAFGLYEKWGIAGVKIDFMASDDQAMVNWYHKMVKAAANHHLMVNFHGAYKPDGFRRTYPNLMTREGVMGNEYNKWSTRITPEHNVTLAFTRMLAGPMDYTPGGFLNRSPDQFRTGTPANVMNTRCHQLAMFVVYNSPITTVCDDPDNYYGQKGLDFLKEVPVVWDDIKFLGGFPGEFVAIAKKSGKKWYIGILNNSEDKEIDIDLSFVGHGKFTMESWSDAADSDVNAEDISTSVETLNSPSSKKIRMARGGGFAAVIAPAK